MPRVSREQTAANRATITEVSSRLFRERGLQAVSVADLMGAAGLTHGGFYGHFESKDALAGIAAGHAFGQAAERWRKRASGTASAAERRAALIDAYLAGQNVRAVGAGCPTVALATDVAREPLQAPIREAYGEGLEALLAVLASVEDEGTAGADRAAALADYATMVGAMMLARATAGRPVSDEILAAARARLVPAPRPARRRATATATPRGD